MGPKNIKTSLRKERDSKRLPAIIDHTTRYLVEISKYPLVTKEEEFELAKAVYHFQDQKASHKLVTANLRFVVKIASEYTRFGLKIIDLIQEGNIGLLIAVKKFNPYRGTRLTSYSAWWIRSYIHDYMLKQWSMVKIGTTLAQKKLFYKLKQEQERLREYLESESNPKLLEHKIIAENLGVREKDVKEMEIRMQGGDISLDTPLGEDEKSGRLLDTIVDTTPNAEEILTKQDLQGIFNNYLDQFVETLNTRDRFILANRLMSDSPLSLQEIGDKYNISRERARQLEEKIKKNLKTFIQKHQPNFSAK